VWVTSLIEEVSDEMATDHPESPFLLDKDLLRTCRASFYLAPCTLFLASDSVFIGVMPRGRLVVRTHHIVHRGPVDLFS
jgi:hypothetical protein